MTGASIGTAAEVELGWSDEELEAGRDAEAFEILDLMNWAEQEMTCGARRWIVDRERVVSRSGGRLVTKRRHRLHCLVGAAVYLDLPRRRRGVPVHACDSRQPQTRPRQHRRRRRARSPGREDDPDPDPRSDRLATFRARRERSS